LETYDLTPHAPPQLLFELLKLAKKRRKNIIRKNGRGDNII
jgi:hypothetical protein